MKILIDASRAVIENAGIARYTKNICTNLPKIDKKNQYDFLVTFMRIDPTKQKKINELKKYGNVIIHYLPGNLKEYLWQKKWAKPLFNHWYKNYDLFFAPSFFELPQFIDIPSILTIHDLTTFRFPKQRGLEISTRLSRITKYACYKAKHIIAVSNQTKQDIIRYCKLPKRKIDTVYLSADEKFVNKKMQRKKFILSVGTLEPRKNIPTLIKAYALLPQKIQNNYQLKIVGGSGWNESKIYDTIKELKLENKIEFMGYIEDRALVKIYNQASIFVYPSIFEGFGLPVLEAMSCGVPVITTNISSLPEVGGKAVEYLNNPTDSKSLSKKIQKILLSEKLQKGMSKKSLIQAKKFSWKDTSLKTIKLLNDNI